MGVLSCGTTMLDQGVFQNIGSVTWDTTAKTSGFTAVSGNGYFCNTTSSAFTVTLPSSPSAGDIVGIKDYANTADTNTITIGRNGSNIQGVADDFKLEIEGGSVFLVYVDGTQGWKVTSSAQNSDIAGPFIEATGGTITTSGDFKIHTFTSPGTFCVSNAGNPAGSTQVDYIVVAGGAGGGGDNGCGSGGGSGGGAGGFRESHSTPVSGCYTASPLATPTGIPVSVQGYPITVGAGGTGGCVDNPGGSGANSIFSTITSAGGGGGTRFNRSNPAKAGGSGGGATMNNGSGCSTGGSGNTPPVSPPQGSNGGNAGSFPNRGSAGGGGATAAGTNNPSGSDGTAGGAGATTNITASPVAYSGGGGGGGWNGASAGSGGTGGGGDGGSTAPGSNGTANTGGAGGGGGPTNAGGVPPRPGGTGGSGIVIIRYKFQ